MNKDETMTPAEAREHLVAYLDGELDESLRSRVEKLVATDPTLAEEVVQLRDSWDLLDLDEAPTASPDFAAGVMHRRSVDAARRGRHRMRTLLAAAAVLLIAVASWQWFGVDRPAPITETELAENLDLLEDLELLESVGEDVEFLAWLEETEESPW